MERPNRISRFGKGLRPGEGPAATRKVSVRGRPGKCGQAFGNQLGNRPERAHQRGRPLHCPGDDRTIDCSSNERYYCRIGSALFSS